MTQFTRGVDWTGGVGRREEDTYGKFTTLYGVIVTLLKDLFL